VINNANFIILNADTLGITSITNNNTGDFTTVRGTSTASNIAITNNTGGATLFRDSGAAGSATITTNSGSVVRFFNTSSGGTAQFITNAGGTFDISPLTSGGMTAGSISGAGSYQLGSEQLTVGSNNLSTTVSGVIADGGIGGGTGGSLVKEGGGTLVLSGVNTYTGGTTINAGTLAISGSVASGVTVNAGGTLMGSGSITGLVSNGGIVAPGNSIGTLTVNGNFTQSGGGIYQVEVNAAGQGDRIDITGTATLAGAVSVLAARGSYARNTSYTILHADGGLGGTTFGSVTSNFAFLVPTLGYTGTDVTLMLVGNASAFAAGAQTANQRAVGTVLDQATASGDLATVIDALSGLSTTQGPAAFNTISGQPYANFGTVHVQMGNAFLGTVGAQLGSSHGGFGGGSSVVLAEACDVACDTTQPGRWGGWLSGLGGTGSVLGDGNAGGLTYKFGGTAAGLDYRFDPSFLVGVGFGYTTATRWVNSFDGRGTTDTFSGSLYASFTHGPVYLDGVVAYASSNNRLTRNIVIPGLNTRVAQGQTRTDQFLGQLEAGYRVDLYKPARTSISPFARLQASTTARQPSARPVLTRSISRSPSRRRTHFAARSALVRRRAGEGRRQATSWLGARACRHGPADLGLVRRRARQCLHRVRRHAAARFRGARLLGQGAHRGEHPPLRPLRRRGRRRLRQPCLHRRIAHDLVTRPLLRRKPTTLLSFCRAWGMLAFGQLESGRRQSARTLAKRRA
jgi:autotransporter-associated beta strand protein